MPPHWALGWSSNKEPEKMAEKTRLYGDPGSIQVMVCSKVHSKDLEFT